MVPTDYNQAYDAPEGPSLSKGKLSSVPASSITPPHYVSLGPQPGPKKGDKKPVYVLDITIPLIFVDNYVEPSKSAVNIQVRPLCLEELQKADESFQNHTILHSFLSSVVEEFLVRNSFAKPPPQVQPREESTQNPRKRRRLGDHTVSVYSPGPSQQSYYTTELGHLPPEQELLQPSCSECSGSCDGCSSCCDECLYTREGDNPNPDLLRSANYGHDELDLGERSLSDEVFDVPVSSSLYF